MSSLLGLIPVQKSSGRIVFLNCYTQNMHVRFSARYVQTVVVHCTNKLVLMHVLPCAAGFYTGHGATKVCMDHIRMVSRIVLEAEPKQWNFLPGL